MWSWCFRCVLIKLFPSANPFSSPPVWPEIDVHDTVRAFDWVWWDHNIRLSIQHYYTIDIYLPSMWTWKWTVQQLTSTILTLSPTFWLLSMAHSLSPVENSTYLDTILTLERKEGPNSVWTVPNRPKKLATFFRKREGQACTFNIEPPLLILDKMMTMSCVQGCTKAKNYKSLKTIIFSHNISISHQAEIKLCPMLLRLDYLHYGSLNHGLPDIFPHQSNRINLNNHNIMIIWLI